MSQKILVVDDDSGVRDTLRMILEYEGYEVATAPDGKTALADLDAAPADAVLLDIKMSGMDGLEVLDKIVAREAAPPVLMISGHGDIATAVESTRRGAVDFLEKPPQRERILVSIANALSRNQLRAENERLRTALDEESVLVGRSAPMQRLRQEIVRAAPVGAPRVRQVNVRVIAATNRDLTESIRENRFREDLFFRLNVVPIRTPPLRERSEDIPDLVEHFARRFSDRDHRRPRRFGSSALALLKARAWPGNVRELRNLVERVLIMTDADPIEAKDLPPAARVSPS